MKKETLAYIAERKEVCAKIRRIIVGQLSLDLDPDFIADDQPLFGRGLDLDSIDALELAVGIYDEFSITISDGNTRVFSSVNTIADYLMEQMKQQKDSAAEGETKDEL